MSASAAVLTRSWQVGAHTVTLTIPRPVAGETKTAAFEWSPAKPQRLSTAELGQYRAGRDAAITELSEAMGLRVALVEV